AEPAAGGELGDVVEGVGEAPLPDPEMHLPHAGVVDDDAPVRQEDEPAPRGGVAPRALPREVAGREARVVPDQCVDESRLPDTGWSEQHARPARAEEFP